MGTTLTALQAGSLNFCYVVAIEGYSKLVTNGPTSAVVTAWAGTDFTEAIGGLFVDVDPSQQFHPLRAFSGGGRAVLRIAPDGDDTFGIDLFATDRGDFTYLASALDCDDTTITVKDTSNFASSGHAHIGTECFAYSGKTATTFTGVTRGKFSPFNTESGGRFARPHRAGLLSALNMNLEPVVSENKRSWEGALVGIWVCRVVDGVVDTRAQAQLVFAGTIAGTRDDAETGQSVIECTNILAMIQDASLVRDQFKARIADGMYIRPGQTFEFEDRWVSSGNVVTISNAADLVCVVGTPADEYEIEEGYYTCDELATAINAWLAAARGTSDITGNYNLISPDIVQPGEGPIPGSYRSNMQWRNDNGVKASWSLRVPHDVAVFLGLEETYEPGSNSGDHTSWGAHGDSDEYHFKFSEFAPLRWYIPAYFASQYKAKLVDIEGTIWDNYPWMPHELWVPDGSDSKKVIGALDPTLGDWAIFTINGKPFIVGALDGDELVSPRRFFNHDDFNVRYEPNTSAPRVELAQVYALHAPWKTIIKALFFSTGTAAFNSTYDALPHTLSVGIPGELLGSTFTASVDNAPEGDEWQTMIIEKPLTLEKLLNVDFILRGMHLQWKNQGLRFRQWETPLTTNAVTTLTEANKALPASTRGSYRAPSSRTTEWLTPIIKIMFAREWTSDTYTDGPLVLEDRVSIDDLGGRAPEKTLEARNMTKDQVMAVAHLFLARMPNISRPAFKTRRTIDQTLFETLTPGDCVLLTDGFMRDPVTGIRSVVEIPAMVIGIRYSLGGPNAANPTSTESQLGEVDLLMFPGKRFALYAPSGQVDHTASAGGFTAGYNSATNTLRLNAHEFSESSDPLVDAARFTNGDLIEVYEVDPSDPTNPTKWDRTVSSVSSNDITLTSGLSSPAYDVNKKYRIRSQEYSVATTTQRAKVYQALDATARIESIANPFHYTGPTSGVAFTAEDHTAVSELVPTLGYGDGSARDVGIERTLVRTLNNLMDHRVRRNSPVLRAGNAAQLTAGGGAGPGGFRMAGVSLKYFGQVQPNAFSARYVGIGPRFRSGTGASVTVRVTLCRNLPTNSSYDNVTFIAPFEQHTWTTTSTTWQDGAAADFDLRNIGQSGVGVVVIELSDNAQCLGLSYCRESERVET